MNKTCANEAFATSNLIERPSDMFIDPDIDRTGKNMLDFFTGQTNQSPHQKKMTRRRMLIFIAFLLVTGGVSCISYTCWERIHRRRQSRLREQQANQIEANNSQQPPAGEARMPNDTENNNRV